MLINNIEVTVYDMFEEEIEIEDMLNEEVEIIKIECHEDLSMDIYVKTQYCKYAHEYAEQTSNEFSNMTWSHGLSGKNKPAHEAIKSLLNNPSLERCCSHVEQKVGHVGVYVTGKVLMASNIDLMSMPTVDGHRGIDISLSGKRTKGIIYSPEQLDTTVFCNGEIIITDMQITGIWAEKEYITDELIAISKELNLEINVGE